MKKNLSELILILDKSGSMGDVRSDALGGINTFITEQKKEPGEANLTLVLFDTSINTFFDRRNIKDTRPLKEEEYVPSGCTALLKAVSDTIDSVGEKLAREKEADRPEKVIVVIMTDGHENASNENTWNDVIYTKTNLSFLSFPLWEAKKEYINTIRYTKEKLKQKIEHQHDVYKWEFIFLGADASAFDEGNAMGMRNSYSFNATPMGTQALYASANNVVKEYRTSGKLDDTELKDLVNKK
jgi:uncharacterized protein YegL